MANASVRSARALLFPVFAALFACGNIPIQREGGLNDNQHAPGDGSGGVKLGAGDLAVPPTGDFVLFSRNGVLAVGSSSSSLAQPLPVRDPSRLVFSKVRPVVYVGAPATNELVALDLSKRTVLWRAAVPDASTSLLQVAVTADDRYILAADTRRGMVNVLDAGTGAQKRTLVFGAEIVDLAVLPDDQRAVAVLAHRWAGDAASTNLEVISLDAGTTTTVYVPNCSDKIGISNDGHYGFIAPTDCLAATTHQFIDPISVVDLTAGHENFVENLPGFGPVAMSPTGNRLVGFFDRTEATAAALADPAQMPGPDTPRYHLMLVDQATLHYEFVPVGDNLPRFAVTPDGNVLMVDAVSTGADDLPARLFDVPTHTWKYIDGAPLFLDDFVISTDSRHAYAIETHFYSGLYDLDIGGSKSSALPLPFLPTAINITPDDAALFLRKSDSVVCVYSLATNGCTTEIQD